MGAPECGDLDELGIGTVFGVWEKPIDRGCISVFVFRCPDDPLPAKREIRDVCVQGSYLARRFYFNIRTDEEIHLKPK